MKLRRTVAEVPKLARGIVRKILAPCALIEAQDKLLEEALRIDRKRLEYYLTYRGEDRGTAFLEFEMRVLSGDDPTIEEWIEAIDAAMLSKPEDHNAR